MEIRIASEPPWPYGPPGNLAPPDHLQSFESYLQRLKAFSRDGLLDMGSRVLWYPWENRIPSSGEAGNVITETFGPDVIGLALMFCTDAGVDAEEVDFRLLCWELFRLGSFAPPESDDAAREIARLAERWADRLGATPFVRLTPDTELMTYVRGLWMKGRMFATHLLSLPDVASDAARTLLLHDALEAEVKDVHAYRAFRHVYFRNEPSHLLRHALMLLGLVTSDSGAVPRCPGRFDVFRADEESEQVVDFAQFGQLACINASEFPGVGERLLALSAHERKLSAEARSFTFKPGAILDERSDRRAFMYPAPRRLLRSLHRLFLDDFIDFLEQDPRFVECGGAPAASLWGSAIHRTLGASLGPNVLLIDDADCPIPGKRPDAVWCGDRFGVVFEAKSRVTPRSDPELLSPDSILEAWRRCWEAVEQAADFVQNEHARRWIREKTGRAPQVWTLAIAIDEELIAERTSFRHATSRWNLLAGTGLAGLALVSMNTLESLVAQSTPDGLGRSIERLWIESANDALQQPPEAPNLAVTVRPAHLEEALQRIVRGDV